MEFFVLSPIDQPGHPPLLRRIIFFEISGFAVLLELHKGYSAFWRAQIQLHGKVDVRYNARLRNMTYHGLAGVQ